MIGRGTRLCENLLALGKDKEQFVILIIILILNFSVKTLKDMFQKNNYRYMKDCLCQEFL